MPEGATIEGEGVGSEEGACPLSRPLWAPVVGSGVEPWAPTILVHLTHVRGTLVALKYYILVTISSHCQQPRNEYIYWNLQTWSGSLGSVYNISLFRNFLVCVRQIIIVNENITSLMFSLYSIASDFSVSASPRTMQLTNASVSSLDASVLVGLVHIPISKKLLERSSCAFWLNLITD